MELQQESEKLDELENDLINLIFESGDLVLQRSFEAWQAQRGVVDVMMAERLEKEFESKMDKDGI